ncbi:MAG TPA: WYL domain-containing protein [Planctomycetota bacterium]|nr:WYL domain-containing protein [Planctomycetota bacterium]
MAAVFRLWLLLCPTLHGEGRHMDQTHEHLKRLMEAAYSRRVTLIAYFAPSGAEKIVREIEPYSIIGAGQATMLKAFQLAPKPGWRLFNVKFIADVRATDKTFELRRSRVLRTGDEVKHIAPMEAKDIEQQEYERLVQTTIIDLEVTPEESANLSAARERLGLSVEEVRGVHYRIFSDCLLAVTQDRIVTDEERTLLIDLNHALQACGAGLIQ